MYKISDSKICFKLLYSLCPSKIDYLSCFLRVGLKDDWFSSSSSCSSINGNCMLNLYLFFFPDLYLEGKYSRKKPFSIFYEARVYLHCSKKKPMRKKPPTMPKRKGKISADNYKSKKPMLSPIIKGGRRMLTIK